MDGSMTMGFMAVFAVSGSVALLALQIHKRLLSHFLKRIDFEFGDEKWESKRRVKLIGNLKETSVKVIASPKDSDEKTWLNGGVEPMPLNRVALYKGIIKHRMLFAKTKSDYGVSVSRARTLSNASDY